MRSWLRMGVAAMAITLAAGAARAADLTVWGLQAFNQAADDYIGQMVRDFGKANNISAEYVVVPANVINDRLAAAFQGNAPPDVFMQTSQRVQFYIGGGLTTPLDDVLADMRKVPGGILEKLLSPGQSGGVAHGLPLEADVSPMFARKDLLDEVGKKVPATWEEFREAAKAIQAKHPNISGFGMTISNSADAEGQIRQVMWAFGGKVMAEDGKTVVFNSPETRAAYQFVADMFLKDRIIPRAALTWDDSGNNIAYQTKRAAFVINPPSIYWWMRENDKELLANSLMIDIPKGPGPNGQVGNAISSWMWIVAKQTKRPDMAKAWLRYFYEPTRYAEVVNKVGGRWAPVFAELFTTMPLFRDTPAFANFKSLASEGFTDGYAGPPNVLSGRVADATILTKALQKVLVDGTSVADAVAWGQAQIEELAKQK